jgi:hypothetical protein
MPCEFTNPKFTEFYDPFNDSILCGEAFSHDSFI